MTAAIAGFCATLGRTRRRGICPRAPVVLAARLVGVETLAFGTFRRIARFVVALERLDRKRAQPSCVTIIEGRVKVAELALGFINY